jgi:iron complex transport system substrate-binding protein
MRRFPGLAMGLFRSLLGGALIAIITTPSAAAPPERIVSLNVCTDQILVDLVPRSRIAAVTHLATDPLSAAHPERAVGLRTTRGAAEDVLATNPDLVIAGTYSTPATVAILRRVGRRVETVPQPSTIAGVRDLIRTLAQLVEEPVTGERLISTMDQRIAVAHGAGRGARPEARPGERPSAIVYQVNNYVSATGSLIDEALVLAGYRNGAADLRIGRNGQVGLEALAAKPPDLLILASGPTTYRTAVGDNLRHPILARLASTTRSTVVPWPLWLCGTHHVVEAVEKLAAMRWK